MFIKFSFVVGGFFCPCRIWVWYILITHCFLFNLPCLDYPSYFGSCLKALCRSAALFFFFKNLPLTFFSLPAKSHHTSKILVWILLFMVEEWQRSQSACHDPPSCCLLLQRKVMLDLTPSTLGTWRGSPGSAGHQLSRLRWKAGIAQHRS